MQPFVCFRFSTQANEHAAGRGVRAEGSIKCCAPKRGAGGRRRGTLKGGCIGAAVKDGELRDTEGRVNGSEFTQDILSPKLTHGLYGPRVKTNLSLCKICI